VTVRAAHVALGDLGSDGVPTGGVPDELAHFYALQLRVTVVELEHEWIVLAAIHAAVL
jgi:hypothetical protein